MSVSTLSLLTHTDMFFDYVPFISTATNLIDIFQKCVVIPLLDREFVEENHYLSHLKSKSYLRCVFLLVPILGNLIIIGVDSVSNRRDLEELNDNLEVLAEETLKNIELREKHAELKSTLSNLKGERRALLKVLNQGAIERDRENVMDRLISTRGIWV